MDGSPSTPDGFENVNCPCCGGAAWTLARQGHDWALHPDRLINIARCNSCGMHYTNPRPTLARLPDYYSAEYSPYQRQRGEVERSSKLSTWARLLVLRSLYGAPKKRPGIIGGTIAKSLLLFKDIDSFGFGVPFRGQGRLLDFGCGSGTFLRRMKALGWNVMGIDFSSEAVDAVRAGGIDAVQGTLPHADLKPGSFDVVTLRQALEHVPDPRLILSEVHKLLAPGGQIVIQVPNFDSWEIEYFGDAAHTLDLPRHLLHFTPATLSAMLEISGFRRIDVTQACPTGWLRKSLAKVHQRGSVRELDEKLKNKRFLRKMARQSVREGRGNELIAVAEI